MYMDLSKHLYDLTILFKTKRIQDFFSNTNEFEKIVAYKREEEIYRKGGVDKNIQIKDFGYFNMEYNEYVENALDEADREAEDPNTKYYTHEEFKQIARGILDGKE